MKEFRIEISREKDFDLIYAEDISRKKFQLLVKSWKLNISFEEFPGQLVGWLKKGGTPCPVAFNCTMNKWRTSCSFGIICHISVVTVDMQFELRAVRGDDLRSHHMNSFEELKSEFAAYKKRMEGEVADLKRKLQLAEEKVEKEASMKEDLEGYLELERDEHNAAHSMID